MIRRRYNFISYVIKRHYSALYVTGDKAKENFVVLVPFLDFQEKLENVGKLEENLNLRKSSFDLHLLKNEWKIFENLQNRRKNLEKARVEISEQIKKMKLLANEPEMEKLKMHGIMLRDELKMLKENSYALTDRFVNHFLALPNDVHERNMSDKKYQYRMEASEKLVDNPSHTNLIEKLEECIYMKKDAALLDLHLPMYASNVLRDLNFIQFSNPDFVRTLLLEAAGYSLDHLNQVEEEQFEVKNKLNLLHLCGGSSLFGYLGFITKLSLFQTALPLRFVSIGRQYEKEAPQTNAVQIFVAAKDETDSMKIFDQLIEIYKEIYSNLKLEFKFVQVSPPNLEQSESLRVNVQVRRKGEFVNVGNLSYYTDYISKRLLFNFKDGKDYRFPHIISGSIMKTMPLIEAMMINGIKYDDIEICRQYLE